MAKDEIVYLNKAYPRMGTLFNQTGEISTAILHVHKMTMTL